MSGEQLGRLRRVDLRDIWISEAQDFTPWLARSENLEELASTLSMELELEAQERNVGPFRADLLCKDVDSGAWVLIENQLERTDHIHLGQLLTYAAGLEAVTIVWIAAQFTEEHRATLDWLNEITDERFRFFGLEVELWWIGESSPAPKFNVVSKPNDWSRTISRAARQVSEGSLSETKAQQLQFWEGLKTALEQKKSPVRHREPRPQHWTTFSIGRAGFYLAAKVNTRDHRVSVELFINAPEAKAFFHLLSEQKEEIEREMQAPLSWEELPERMGSRVAIYRDGVDPTDEQTWPELRAWVIAWLEKFNTVLRPYVRDLVAEEWQPIGAS